jgi:CRISPR-associated protein Csm1
LEVKSALMAYGLKKLANATGGDAAKLLSELGEIPAVNWQTYEARLGSGGEREEALSCILSWIALPDEQGRRTLPTTAYYVARSLALEKEVLFPYCVTDEYGQERLATTGEARKASDLVGLWQDFEEKYKTLWERLGSDEDALFEGFYYLYHKYAWAVPCTYGERGVSLFQQWKAIAALVFASGGAVRPAKDFTLIGGDIPGIQDFVYTITSKGAAKGLRGRSFFIQLLGDAVVRRILADLNLCSCNVIYDAGGNFIVLGPEETEAKEVIDRIRRQVNARLVEAIQGDTALVLEAMSVTPADLFTPSRFKDVREAFGRRIAEVKNRPLRELAMGKKGWETLFKPKGKGSRLSCAVCRIEVDEHNSKPLERTGEVPEEAERPCICYLCDSFAELARDIRHEKLWIAVTEKPEMLGTKVEPTDGWEKLLGRMTGFHYKFSKSQLVGEGNILALNRLDFLDAGAHGFRLLANITPVVTEDDFNYLREEERVAPRKMEMDMPHKEDIRSFSLLAHAAAAATAGAIERVGVLRMDVDELGRVFSEGVPDLTLPKLSALSGAMDLFFSGYLNVLVRAQAENDLYIIYAGGDDLFIVGAWHHLPDLAEAIRNQFKAFTGNNPVLSLSGGITLEGAKFPLYRAAERAGEAEGKAKGHTRPDGGAKDALCFLDTVVGWEDWGVVRQQQDEILWLIGVRDSSEDKRRLSRALLQVVQSIHQLYRTGLRDARRRVRRENRQRPPDKKLPLPKPQMFFGRWAWMQAYSLVRMARRSRDDKVKTRIMDLQKALMQPAMVRYSGLAARWAEYLTRRHLEPWRKRLKLDERV